MAESKGRAADVRRRAALWACASCSEAGSDELRWPARFRFRSASVRAAVDEAAVGVAAVWGRCSAVNGASGS